MRAQTPSYVISVKLHLPKQIENRLEKSFCIEDIEDLISIVNVFSSRLDGLRKYKKVIKDDKEVLNREVKLSSSIIPK